MNIVILGSAHPLRGGLAAFNERLAKEFIMQQDTVTIETFSLQYPEFLFPGTTQYSSLPKPNDLHINVSVNSINPLNWIKVGLKIRKQKPDILIVKFWLPFMAPCLGTICRIVKSNKHTKIISILDNILPHEKRIGDTIFTNYFVKSVDAFIAMSDSVYKDLSLFDKTKPRLLNPHPLFDNYGQAIDKKNAIEQLNLNPNYKYILFFGLIRDYKGLDIVLKAMALPKIKSSDIKLIVAGEYYSNKEEYEKLIRELNVQDKIELHTRFIPDNEVATYFCAADLVVQPYKHATQSGVTQICYHFNKPMLVTNVGGLPEIVPNNKVGLVVEPNEQEVGDAILKFYDENKEAVFLQHILEEKKKYSWQVMVEKIKSLIAKK
ncbi:MAG TPA: glycosyltransferase [Chitinophagales bacterium]|jgi:D-inositol-3-phosphate glycosyltransferase|nr:glycosyltransferase [Chitinophagales bacterium]MBP6154050.1 glycosyltransferase [Chitinophagales bacterium]HQV78348.1 glycosyltransferase [Chitinophagales bacterium]HQW79499.1 glycosyltransferase [Chitinophagales bacterium]HRB18547.1 glycosyltransferase [Chitinophagales bacterium]